MVADGKNTVPVTNTSIDTLQGILQKLNGQKLTLGETCAQNEKDLWTLFHSRQSSNYSLSSGKYDKNAVENDIRILEARMRAEIREAERKGEPTNLIEAYYKGLLTPLYRRLIVATDSYNNLKTKADSASTDYQDMRFKDIRDSGDYITTCNEIASNELKLGNARQAEIVQNYIFNRMA